MKYIPLVFAAVVIILALSCAKQSSPTGGPKDTIPPELIRSNPADKTTNFKGKTIELTFDEDIIINNAREQLIITPALADNKNIEMTARKRTAILNLNTELKDSTTYTINFRESVQDITEKNPAQNLQLAFSTGSYLDSLSIKGYIYDLLKGTFVKDVTIALNTVSDTFNIFKHKPIYLTKSNDKGNYLFENLKPGKFIIYAFTDNNRNLVIDSKTESYGFISNPVDLKPDSTYKVDIPLIFMDARELKLMNARTYNTYFNIKTSKNLKSYNINPIDKPDSIVIYHSYGDDRANIKVFLPTLENDSIQIQFQAEDSVGFKIDTLLYAKRAGRKATPEKFKSNLDKNSLVYTSRELTAQLSFNKPIFSTTYDSILYVADSSHTISFTPDNFTWNKDKSEVTFKAVLPKELFKEEEFSITGNSASASNAPKLIFGKASFISIEEDSTSKIDQPVEVLKPENTAILLVKIQGTGNFIVQVINKQMQVIQEKRNESSMTFNHLPPGDYMIRLIIDRNNNGLWDPGNYFRKEEPEPVIYYRNEKKEQSVSLKANWEVGPLLITVP